MADQKIVIDVRADTKAAQADLRALKASAADTARQLAAVGKQVSAADAKRSQLAERLNAARKAAADAAKAVEDMNRQIAQGQQYDALTGRNDALSQTLAQQDEKLKRLQADYEQFLAARDKLGDSFTDAQAQASDAANANYKARIAAAQAAADATAAELDKVTRQLDALRSQGAQPGNADDGKKLAGLNAALEKQQAAVQAAEQAYEKQNAEVAALQTKHSALNAALEKQQALLSAQPQAAAQQQTARAVQSAAKRFAGLNQAAAWFGTRLKGLVVGALVFNVVSKALRQLVTGMGTALLQIQGVKSAFTQLKGAAATAAAGLANLLAPAVTFVLNLVNALMNAFIRLIALISGKSVAALKKQGKALTAAGGAAKKAAGQLAAFDELNVLNKQNSGGGATIDGVGETSAAWAAFTEKLKTGFDAAFASARTGLANLKADAAKVGDALRRIWASPAVAAAVAGFTQNALFALGQLAGAAASVGVSVAENLVGGLARYLEAFAPYITESLTGIFSAGGALAQLLGNAAQALAEVFRSLGSEGAKQLTAGLLGTLSNTLLGMAQTLGNTLLAALTPLLQPIIDNADKIREVLSGALAAIVPFFQGAAQGVADFYTALSNLYNDVILPVSAALAEGLSGSLGVCLDALLDLLQAVTGASDGLHALGVVVGWVVGGVTAAIAVFAAIKLTIAAVTAVLAAAKLAAAAFGVVVAALSSPFTLAALAIGAVIAAGVALYKNWDTVKAKAGELVANLQAAFEGLKQRLEQIFSSLGSFFSGLFSPIVGMIQAVSSAASGVSGARGGSSQSSRSPRAARAASLAALPVPALAGGAVIPANRRFLAMLGDQTSGTNIEAPLDTIKQAVAEVMNGFASGGEQPINIYIGEELLDTVIAGSQRRRAVRSGGR